MRRWAEAFAVLIAVGLFLAAMTLGVRLIFEMMP